MVRPVPIPNTAVKHSLADGSGFIDSARVGCRQFFRKNPPVPLPAPRLRNKQITIDQLPITNIPDPFLIGNCSMVISHFPAHAALSNATETLNPNGFNISCNVVKVGLPFRDSHVNAHFAANPSCGLRLRCAIARKMASSTSSSRLPRSSQRKRRTK